FDPDRFDAADIARSARQAGMRYAVLTTKHHEGFAMFDTSLSDYNSVATCGRDFVAEFVQACRAEGLRVGLYHSLIDWHHPDFTIDQNHPLRDRPDVAQLNAGRDMARYRAYLHGQVRELLTHYGQIDYLFFDFTYPDPMDGKPGKGPEDWDSAGLLAMVRELQPGIVVNDRLGIPGDLVTPEQYQPDAPMQRDGAEVLWEACQTLNGSWGYDRDNLDFKSPDLLIRMLVDTVSKNGNMLLNIGPDGRGAITPVDRRSLAALGDWMYLHLLHWPFGHVHLPDMAGKVNFARFLHDGSEVRRSEIDPDQQAMNTIPGGQPPGTLTLNLPTAQPPVAVPVIELFLTEE